MHDFDQNWRRKLSKQLESRAGAAARDQILNVARRLDEDINQLEVIMWTREVIHRMASALEAQTCRDVMTDCACHYPEEQLKPLRALYQRTGDLRQVHVALQEQFETFLRESLKLDDSMIVSVVTRGWGAAGILEGDSIIATKIPKSGCLRDYFQESDPEVRRTMYCHCPRVRDAIKAGEELPRLYCYCGAGFYKHIWETILQEMVRVEVLESVLSGGEVCKVAIRLPVCV